MKTKVKKKHRSTEEMMCYIKEWEGSGESKKSFCTRRGISPSILHYWYSKLQDGGMDNEKGFVEVTPTLKSSSNDPIQIIFPSGAKIILSQGIDPSIIRSIVY
jgi:hypothetical protein